MAEFELVQEPAQLVAVVRRVVAMDALKDFFDTVFGEVAGAVGAAGGVIAGPPFGWFYGMPSDTVDVSAGFPVQGVAAGNLAGDVDVQERPGGRSIVGIHAGPYEAMEKTYERLMSWMAEQGLEGRGDMWEEYLTDPGSEPDTSKWQTRIVWPVL